jgi:hypothetical protein
MSNVPVDLVSLKATRATEGGQNLLINSSPAKIDSLKIVQVSLSVDHLHAGYPLKISCVKESGKQWRTGNSFKVS